MFKTFPSVFFIIFTLSPSFITSLTPPDQTPLSLPFNQQILNCVFTSDSSSSTYDCTSINLTITERFQSINYLQGEHTRNHSILDVNGLKVSSQICHFFPSQLSRIIPKLKRLEITYSGLLEILSVDTFEMQNLEILNLKGNRIGNLDYGIFKENKELTSIDFSDNFITFVASDFFNCLNKLKFVDFGNNLCVKNSPAGENVREWEKELKRNCDVDEMRRGIIRPLWKIYQVLYNRFNGQGMQGIVQGQTQGFVQGRNPGNFYYRNKI